MATKFLRQIILEELQKVLQEVDSEEMQSSMSTPQDPFQDIPGVEPGQTMTPSGISIKKTGPCGVGYDVKCRPTILKLQKLINKYAGYYPISRVKEDGIRGPETDKAFVKLTNLSLKEVSDKEIAEMVIPAFREDLSAFKKNPKTAVAKVMKFICDSNPSHPLCINSSQEPTSKAATPGPSEPPKGPLPTNFPPKTHVEEEPITPEGTPRVFKRSNMEESLIRKELARMLKNL
ncbi:MAG: hypothetical protein EB127_16455 [Alphaproteobacteria bacterium]|nr:hypothetical protein [Alphaproteobacteria bacterium]